MSDLIKVLAKLTGPCRIIWPSGLEITVKVDCIAEVTNGLEQDEPEYLEYWMVAAWIT